MKNFNLEISPDGKYYIPQITEHCMNTYFSGINMTSSWLVLYARIFNLKYSDFLRMVRDLYGATLSGRNGGYINFTFNEKMLGEKFIKDTEKRFKAWIKN